MTCREVLLSGLIPPVSPKQRERFAKSCGASRLEAQRNGSSQPTVGHKRASNTHLRLPQVKVPRLNKKTPPEVLCNVLALASVFNPDGTLTQRKRLRTKTNPAIVQNESFRLLVERAKAARTLEATPHARQEPPHALQAAF